MLGRLLPGELNLSVSPQALLPGSGDRSLFFQDNPASVGRNVKRPVTAAATLRCRLSCGETVTLRRWQKPCQCHTLRLCWSADCLNCLVRTCQAVLVCPDVPGNGFFLVVGVRFQRWDPGASRGAPVEVGLLVWFTGQQFEGGSCFPVRPAGLLATRKNREERLCLEPQLSVSKRNAAGSASKPTSHCVQTVERKWSRLAGRCSSLSMNKHVAFEACGRSEAAESLRRPPCVPPSSGASSLTDVTKHGWER